MGNNLFNLILSGISLFVIMSLGLIGFVYIYQKKRHLHFKQIEDLEIKYNEELLKSQLEIQEQTFRTISLEIHDNIGQVLSLTKLNLGIMAPYCSHLPMMAFTQELVAKVITDIRNLSKSLSPERLAAIDVQESIGYELQMLEKTGLFSTSLVILHTPYALPQDKKIILFRIFQEVVNNIVKHAAATAITTEMAYQNDFFLLTISDNGKGFNTQNVDVIQHSGIGLKNMQHRATIIGATLSITSAEGSGTTVTIRFPIMA